MSQATAVFDLFVSFARVTLFGFGGGPSMIPLVRAEVVEGRGWLTPEAFLDAFAFGNALPGPIVTKLAFYVGHQVAGWPGAAAALLGASLPTLVLMLVVVGLLLRNKENRVLQAAIGGSEPSDLAGKDEDEQPDHAAPGGGEAEFHLLREAAVLGHELGLQVNAGHGITLTNLPKLLQVPHLAELNVGHHLVARAIFLGLARAVRDMRTMMSSYPINAAT